MGKYPFIEVLGAFWLTVRGDLANERRKVKEIFSICCNWEQEPWYSKIYG